jgi:hypothetical protein
MFSGFVTNYGWITAFNIVKSLYKLALRQQKNGSRYKATAVPVVIPYITS